MCLEAAVVVTWGYVDKIELSFSLFRLLDPSSTPNDKKPMEVHKEHLKSTQKVSSQPGDSKVM